MRARYLLCLAALPLACARAEGDPSTASPAEGPLLVELFTSQGCSSCPAADRLLSKLAAAGSLGDRTVVPLAFHVDYWNDLGWSDPYSSAAWTERQRRYAQALKDDRVYTPELVVGGAADMIGSDAAAVTRSVRQAARPALLAATASWTIDSLVVTATAPKDADVWVAVWEERTTTKVTRGENSGETLGSSHVVRRLERVAAAGQPGAITVKIDPAWHAPGAVAFAQRADQRIVATTRLARAAARLRRVGP
jgi:hypothetical protein